MYYSETLYIISAENLLEELREEIVRTGHSLLIPGELFDSSNLLVQAENELFKETVLEAVFLSAMELTNLLSMDIVSNRKTKFNDKHIDLIVQELSYKYRHSFINLLTTHGIQTFSSPNMKGIIKTLITTNDIIISVRIL